MGAASSGRLYRSIWSSLVRGRSNPTGTVPQIVVAVVLMDVASRIRIDMSGSSTVSIRNWATGTRRGCADLAQTWFSSFRSGMASSAGHKRTLFAAAVCGSCHLLSRSVSSLEAGVLPLATWSEPWLRGWLTAKPAQP
jgi:hypothetical protein